MKSSNSNSFGIFFGLILFLSSIGAEHVLATTLDYSPYQKVLDNFVVESAQSTKVKYSALKNDSADLNQFNKAVSAVQISEFKKWSESDQIAFLINSYNSFTLQLIVDHYPVKSIKDIGGIFGNPWKKKFFKFLGETSNLDRIEHEILRKNYREPRIHFAVNCASIGCPPLQKTVYEGEKLEKQLAFVAQNFIKSSNFNRYDSGTHSLMLSSIFKWYGADFGNEEQLRKFIADQLGATGELRESLLKTAKIQFLEYDWNLNEAK